MGAAEKRSGSPASKKQACRRRERCVLRDAEEEDERSLCFWSKKTASPSDTKSVKNTTFLYFVKKGLDCSNKLEFPLKTRLVLMHPVLKLLRSQWLNPLCPPAVYLCSKSQTWGFFLLLLLLLLLLSPDRRSIRGRQLSFVRMTQKKMLRSAPATENTRIDIIKGRRGSIHSMHVCVCECECVDYVHACVSICSATYHKHTSLPLIKLHIRKTQQHTQTEIFLPVPWCHLARAFQPSSSSSSSSSSPTSACQSIHLLNECITSHRQERREDRRGKKRNACHIKCAQVTKLLPDV